MVLSHGMGLNMESALSESFSTFILTQERLVFYPIFRTLKYHIFYLTVPLYLHWYAGSSQIVSNMLFILIRTFLKNKIQLDSKIDEKEKLPQIDTISALNEIATAWHTQFVPLIVSLYLNFFLPKDLFELKSINLVMWVILICNCLTAVIIFFLIFVSWKTGPAWWVAISPKLDVLMTISCYIIMPTGVMILSLYYFIADYDQMHLSPNLSWVVAYSVLSLSRIIEFFVTIKPIHINDA